MKVMPGRDINPGLPFNAATHQWFVILNSKVTHFECTMRHALLDLPGQKNFSRRGVRNSALRQERFSGWSRRAVPLVLFILLVLCGGIIGPLGYRLIYDPGA